MKKTDSVSKIIKRAQSKDSIRGFVYNTEFASVFPNFSFGQVLNMVDSDPVARGAVQHFVDKCLEGDFSIINKEDFSYNLKEEMQLQEKYNIRKDVISKIFLAGKLFKNVFVEIVRTTDNKPKFLNILDTQNIEPITEPNGDPIRYKSNIPNPKDGTYPTWEKENIVWIKFGDITKGYAPVDLKCLWETLLAKEYVTRYVAWLWKTGQYRVLYNPKSGSDKDIMDFMAYAKRHDGNYNVPFIFKGELETKILRDMKETENIVELLKYYDGQILIALRVPPIDAGIPDASGRSSADTQTNNLSTSITAMKHIIEDSINFDLFPKIGKSHLLLRFAPNDRFSERQVFENIQIMKSINMTDNVVQEYLADRGIFFKATLFNKPEEVSQESDVANPKEKDLFVSRQRSTASGQGNQNQDEVSTREDQLHKVD